MANIAIEVRVGNSPLDYKIGYCYYFSVEGREDTKMLPKVIMEQIESALQKEFGDVLPLKHPN